MKKVICIKDEWYILGGNKRRTQNAPKFGEVCAVIDENQFEGLCIYRLLGYEGTYHENWWWDSRDFALLSDIDEIEEAKKRNLEKADSQSLM